MVIAEIKPLKAFAELQNCEMKSKKCQELHYKLTCNIGNIVS